jgi:prepilin-type processing-associated H-X9-DG protein
VLGESFKDLAWQLPTGGTDTNFWDDTKANPNDVLVPTAVALTNCLAGDKPFADGANAAEAWDSPCSGQNIALRHSGGTTDGGANMVFGDGHAKFLTKGGFKLSMFRPNMTVNN